MLKRASSVGQLLEKLFHEPLRVSVLSEIKVARIADFDDGCLRLRHLLDVRLCDVSGADVVPIANHEGHRHVSDF